MPFRKVNSKQETEKAIKKNPELKKYMDEAEEEYKSIKESRLNKKFGD